MSTTFGPQDFIIWLQDIDVNGTTDAEAEKLSTVEIESDAQLEDLMLNWIKPRFLQNTPQNQEEMKTILRAAEGWGEKRLRPVFDSVAFPSGQPINDIPRFIKALRRHILD